jgi:hypothetical protein
MIGLIVHAQGVNRMQRFWRWLKGDERGQSIVEVSAVSVFLILLVLVIFEVGVTFASYVALLNASREGAVYASAHPELLDDSRTADDSSAYLWYTESVVKGEVRSGNMVDPDQLIIHRPVIVDGTGKFGDPIKVQVDYRLYSFTSSIQLPFFGRMGLPNYWPLSASTTMPIR